LITLGELWNAIRTILNVVSQILGIASIIQGNTAKTAQENVQFSIDTNTSITEAAVTDGTIGLAAIKAELTTIETTLTSLASSVALATDLAAISGQLTGLSSALPVAWVTPIGNAVWGWPVPTSNNPASFFLSIAGWAAQQRGFPQVQEDTPFATGLWTLVGTWGEDGVSDPNPNTTFDLDVTTILTSDATSADWLNRVYSTVTWLPAFPNGCLGLDDVDGSNWSWVVDLPIDKWLALKADLGLSSTSKSAPIWPGLSNVTLGSSTALSNGLVVTGPMDGVIVAITSAPAGKAKYVYGTVAAYQHVGALSFESDNSDQEAFQPLQFESQVYVPNTMMQAASVRFKVDPAVTGTVTPWSAN